MTTELVADVPRGYVEHLFDIRGRVAVVTGGGSGSSVPPFRSASVKRGPR